MKHFYSFLFLIILGMYSTHLVEAQGITADHVANQVLVTYAPEMKAKAMSVAKGLSLQEQVQSNMVLLNITDGKTVEQKIAELKAQGNVIAVQPNFIYYPQAIPTNDALKDTLWGLDNVGQSVDGPYGNRLETPGPLMGTVDADMDVSEAWGISQGSEVIVAVIDTGVAYTHPDLISQMWDGSNCKSDTGVALGGCIHGYNTGFGDNIRDPYPDGSNVYVTSHGTHVAGTIAAASNNNIGITGIAPKAKIMAIDASNNGEQFETISLIKAINFARYNGAKVINMSLGMLNSCSASLYGDLLAEYQALRDFPGIVVVGAGNDATELGDSSCFTPGSFAFDNEPYWTALPNVISVAATDQNDQLALFSNYGDTTIAAPGTNIWSTVVTGLSETSISGPTISDFTDEWIHSGTASIFDLGSSNYMFIGDAASFPYTANSAGTVMSPPLNLTGKKASLETTVYCDTELTDSLYPITDDLVFKISKNNGPFDSYKLYFGLSYNNSGEPVSFLNETILEVLGAQIVDFGGGHLGRAKVFSDVEIPAEYLTNDFRIMVEWSTNGVDNDHAGCFYDLAIRSTVDRSEHNLAYESYEGTSMATPNATGVVALAWGYTPEATRQDIISAIINGADEIPALAGKVVGSRRINAYETLRILKQQFIPLPKVSSWSFYQNGQPLNTYYVNGDTVEVRFSASTAITTPTVTILGHTVPVTTSDNINFIASYTTTINDHTTDAIPFTVSGFSDYADPTAVGIDYEGTLDSNGKSAMLNKWVKLGSVNTLFTSANWEASSGDYDNTTNLLTHDRVELYRDADPNPTNWVLAVPQDTTISLGSGAAFSASDLKFSTPAVDFIAHDAPEASNPGVLVNDPAIFGAGATILDTWSWAGNMDDSVIFNQPVTYSQYFDGLASGTVIKLRRFDSLSNTWTSEGLGTGECISNYGFCHFNLTKLGKIALIKTTQIATPAPTPVPGGSSSGGGGGGNNSGGGGGGNPGEARPWVCSDAKPVGIPDLFQLNAINTKAAIFFTPVTTNNTGYYVAYGLTPESMDYGYQFNASNDGVGMSIINELSPNTTYYFRVRGHNGCMPGDWSGAMEVKTTSRDNLLRITYPNQQPRLYQKKGSL